MENTTSVFDGMSDEQIAEFLRSNAYAVEIQTYAIPLTEEELLEQKDIVAETMIEVTTLEVEKKEINKDFDSRIKPMKEVVQNALGLIRDKAQQHSGEVFLMDNQEEGRMVTFDITGREISSRPLLPKERQTSILSINRAM